MRCAKHGMLWSDCTCPLEQRRHDPWTGIDTLYVIIGAGGGLVVGAAMLLLLL